MKKNSLFAKTFAAAVLAVAVAGCGHDFEYTGQNLSEEDAIANAEEQLGITIDPNKSWAMTTQATASVTVFKDYGETYTVKIFSNNPMVDDVAYLLAQGTVVSGNTFNTQFTHAIGEKKVYVAISDSKGYTSVSGVNVENGELKAVFGAPTATAAPRRSQAAPSVANIDAPYNEAWVATYNQTAKEPDNNNVWDDYDNSYWKDATAPALYNPVGDAGTVVYGGTIADKTLEAFVLKWIKPYFAAAWWGGAWTDVPGATDQPSAAKIVVEEIAKAGYKFSDLINGSPGSAGEYVEDSSYVRNFKITGTWNGGINVAASEGLTDNNVRTNAERTIVVTGTWNITDNQKIGSLGQIIVAKGGTVNVASDKTLSMVNQARLIVLPGGKLTGEGKVEVNNGNAEGFENYNGGIINVGTFNNNFGKFYNNGKLYVNEYHGGAQESNIYNHSLVVIDHFGSTANARVFNGCQFYVKNDARIRNYEGVQGSALIVGGELLFSGSQDGTTTPSYVGLAKGALVKCGTLYNNGTSWSGPTNGYAALEIVDKITFLNWQQDAPETGGYFENNIYVKAGTWDNIPTGNGYQAGETATAAYKFFNIVANCTEGGTNGVTKVKGNATELLPADDDFQLGVSGCTPGFKGEGDPGGEETYPIYSYAFEDTNGGDYDMNDVVIRAQETEEGKIQLTVLASGATLELYLRLYPAAAPQAGEIAHYEGQYTELTDDKYNAKEVHAMLGAPLEYGQTQCIMLNTGLTNNKGGDALPAVITIDKGSYNTACLPLAIYSVRNGEMRLSRTGQPPFGIVIPGDWQWPKEYVNIMDAYSNTSTADEGDQSFRTFASSTDANVASHWYKYPVRNYMSK